jgi:UDPglucose 6-dehydrogenase/GDP-mannose 6-dehydrogenase
MGGCGFGGSCLPKDVSALAAQGRQLGLPMSVLSAVLDVNLRQYEQVFRLLGKHFPSLKGLRIVVLGLSFRPDTNDMRESPSIPIVKRLLAEGAKVSAYDPVAGHEARKTFNDSLPLADSLEQALEGVDAVVLATRWTEFLRVPEILAKTGAKPVVVDGRRLLARDSVERYEGIGLG